MTTRARARLHPRAVAAMWAWFAAWGVVLAWPAAAAAGAEFRASPDGDAPLFRDGAIELLDVLWRARGAGSAELAHLVVLLPFAVFGATVPLVIFLAALADKRKLGAPARVVGWLAGFTLGTFFLQALCLWAFAELGALTTGGLARSLGEVRSALAGVAVFSFGVVLAVAVSLVRDLSSAALVWREAPVLDTIRMGARGLGVRPFGTLGAWLWRSAVGLVMIALATALTLKFGGKSGLFLIAVAAAHQLGVAWKVAWRASWLACALRSVQAADDADAIER